jgi:hypothetical protein
MVLYFNRMRSIVSRVGPSMRPEVGGPFLVNGYATYGADRIDGSQVASLRPAAPHLAAGGRSGTLWPPHGSRRRAVTSSRPDHGRRARLRHRGAGRGEMGLRSWLEAARRARELL